jgi:PST family polysaccharide transporter
MTNAELAAGTARGRRVSLGALALSGASVIRLSLQFALLPILARMVGPAEYGLMALAMPVILLASVLADGGLGYALGRQTGADRALESTAFWLTGGVGLVLACAVSAAAWPMGVVLGQPRLPLLLMALSPILLMNALTCVANGRIIREGRFAAFAGGDLLSTGAGAVVALICAARGWGAWSLVAQQLVLWLVKLAWVSAAGRAQVGFQWDFARIRPLLAFGAGTIGALLADFAARNIDSLIVGGVLGATSLGFYAMAYQIVRMPDLLISGPLNLYIFTATARTQARGDPVAVRDLATSAVRLGALALAPVFMGLALIAEPATLLLLGERWASVAPVMAALSPAGFAFSLCAVMAGLAMGLGRAGLQASMSAILAVAAIGAVAVTARHGLSPTAWALSAAMLATAGIYLVRLSRALGLGARLIGALAPAAISVLVMALPTAAVGRLTENLSPVIQVIAMIAAGVVAYGAAVAPWRRRIVGDARTFLSAQAG